MLLSCRGCDPFCFALDEASRREGRLGEGDLAVGKGRTNSIAFGGVACNGSVALKDDGLFNRGEVVARKLRTSSIQEDARPIGSLDACGLDRNAALREAADVDSVAFAFFGDAGDFVDPQLGQSELTCDIKKLDPKSSDIREVVASDDGVGASDIVESDGAQALFFKLVFCNVERSLA